MPKATTVRSLSSVLELSRTFIIQTYRLRDQGSCHSDWSAQCSCFKRLRCPSPVSNFLIVKYTGSEEYLRYVCVARSRQVLMQAKMSYLCFTNFIENQWSIKPRYYSVQNYLNCRYQWIAIIVKRRIRLNRFRNIRACYCHP
jgi:hypothetical protein